MQAALSCVRAMIAQVLSAKEDQVLDEITSRQKCTKADAINDPTLTGTEETAFRHHLARRTHADEAYRACGRFVIPQGFMVFATQSVPASIPAEIRTEVAGVTGIAVSAQDLQGFDYGQLKRNPAALSDVEDLTPLIDACGLPVINGQTVLNMESVDEEGTEYIRYYVSGREPAELPAAEFLKKAMVKFVPMVIRCKRKRMFPEDMQGNQNGIYYAMSFEDVAERFVPCHNKNYTSSKSAASNS